MRWLIGLDLRPTGRGALGFARWLRQQMDNQDPHHCIGIHVLEEHQVRHMLRYHHLDEIEKRARELADRSAAEAGSREVLDKTRLVLGRTAEQALAQQAQREAVDAIIIGRQAARAEHRLIRLGRVARRLVRRVPAPVVVVPPDLTADTIGKGPVMLATSLQPDTDEATHFAKLIAGRLHRPLVVVHVVEGLDDVSPNFIPATTRDQLYNQMRLDGERNLELWRRTHDLGDSATVVATGDVVERLVGIAIQEQAAMIVCGCRRLGLGQRLFSASVATDLTSVSEVPVAVVAPPMSPPH